MRSEPGPSLTLGNAAAAHVRLIVWCLDRRRQGEADPAEMVERYGAVMRIPDWHSSASLLAGRRRFSWCYKDV